MAHSVANKSVGSNKSLTKRFTNGHVCFVAAQQKAFQELLKLELQKKERFDRLKTELTMPRNPLIGEPTPREGEGRPIINEYWLDLESPQKAKQKDVTLKIGVDDKKYQFLGNSPTRQKSNPVLVSAGRASLGSPCTAQQPLDAAIDESEFEPQVPQTAMLSSRLTSRANRTPHDKTELVTSRDKNDSFGKRDAWETQGNDFYFKIVKK